MVFRTLIFLAAVWIGCEAMVCFHGICDHLPKRIPDKCTGSVIKNGGICGCYDTCAKQEGEQCEAELIRGRPPLGKCDNGLVCKHQPHMFIGAGECVKVNASNNSVRSTEHTVCQQKRIQSMIVMIVYQGQWFPRCDPEGKFYPQQCNNIGECFCVDVQTGVIDESTRVQGTANCEVATPQPTNTSV
ncbi:hypothetical protein ACF0H5_017598 [Mactra antiquata]